MRPISAALRKFSFVSRFRCFREKCEISADFVSNRNRKAKTLLLLWLILAQSTRWATPWVSWISWAMFGTIFAAWLVRRRRAALLAVWRSPLLPVVGAAVVSALVNDGWWSRVADLALYAVALAYLVDDRPDLDRALVVTGWIVIGICLVEWVYLVPSHRRVHLLGNPNVIACVLAIVLPQGHGWLWWALGGLAMVATGSRAGLLGLAMFAVRKVPKRVGWFGCAALVLVGLVLATARPVNTWYRVVFFSQAITLFVNHPIVGVGPGLYRYREWMHAHNVALTWLSEVGVVGLIGAGAGLWMAKKHTNVVRAMPLLTVAPFFVVDDQTMYWFSALGALYLVVKATRR